MRSFTLPISLFVTSIFLSLVFTNTALAFECTNAGASTTAPDDGGDLHSTACGDGAVASSNNGTAVGRAATASKEQSTAVGNRAAAGGRDSIAVGILATASGISSTAVGGFATASGFHGTAVGISADATGKDSTAVGGGADASGKNNTALGVFAKAFSEYTNASALGFGAQVEQSNAMVLGSIPGNNFGTDYVDVGIGTLTPDAPLHIFRDDGTQEFMFLESDATGGAQDRAMMQVSNNGGIRFQFDNVHTGNAWRFQAGTGNQDNFEITKVGSGELELVLQNDGDLIITGSLVQNSDVNAKQDIEAVDGQVLLAKLDFLPVAEWTYKRDTSGARHLGPMAQDFHAAFGLGEDETKIAPGDMAGISLAAIKAQQDQIKLQQGQIKVQQQKIVDLQKANTDKQAELAEVRDRLARLEFLIQSLNRPTVDL